MKKVRSTKKRPGIKRAQKLSLLLDAPVFFSENVVQCVGGKEEEGVIIGHFFTIMPAEEVTKMSGERHKRRAVILH